MSRVEELALAIQELSHNDFARIAQHVHVLEQACWDAELDRDAASGKLDFLIQKARDDRDHECLKDWWPDLSISPDGTPIAFSTANLSKPEIRRSRISCRLRSRLLSGTSLWLMQCCVPSDIA